MASTLLSTPPPLAPPRTQGETAAWLRLIRSHRVGVVTFFRLMSEHGSAAAALEALPEIAAKAGVAKYQICPMPVIERELSTGAKLGAKLICFGSPDYPASLAEIPDPPPMLWALGDTSLLQKPMISLVGARNASSLGTRMARSLARDLGKHGFVTVSGLARGIDAAAHNATLESGTIAVQGGGIDVIYPQENAKLHDDIAAKGLRLSEQPLGLNPQARHFPRRNRIISGLGQAVVVVEAATKSGSLITAKNALDQGREVLAVPGHPFDGRSTGTNLLIRDGALLIRSAQDVIDALRRPELEEPAARQTPKPVPAQNSCNIEAKILNLLSPTPMAEDQLIRDLSLPSAHVTPALTALEIDGQITRQAGGLLSRPPQ